MATRRWIALLTATALAGCGTAPTRDHAQASAPTAEATPVASRAPAATAPPIAAAEPVAASSFETTAASAGVAAPESAPNSAPVAPSAPAVAARPAAAPAATSTPSIKPAATAPAAKPAPVAARVAPAPTATPRPEVATRTSPVPAKPSPTPVAATPPARPAATAAPAVAAAPVPPGAIGGTRKVIGRVELSAAERQPLSPEEIANTVVYYVPQGGAPRPKPSRFTVITRDKRYIPAAMVIPVGSTVEFPNQDPILHNVFSATPGAAFDLGLVPGSGSAEHRFDTAGVVLVHCNVHHAMQMSILVVDTPYQTRAAADGSFELAGLPEGSGRLYFWHPRAGVATRDVAVPAGGTVSEKLVASQPRIAPHLNKEGKSYRPERK